MTLKSSLIHGFLTDLIQKLFLFIEPPCIVAIEIDCLVGSVIYLFTDIRQQMI